MDEKLQQLLDKQECAELVYKLARGLDRCDADLLKSVFHPDGTDDHGSFKGTRDEFVEWALPFLKTMDLTQHLIGNVLVEVDGDDARGESYAVATHYWYDDGEPVVLTTGFRYLDTFERREGAWKISHRQAVWEWQTWQPRTDRYPRDAGDPNYYGERGPGDPVYAHLAKLAR